jgi:ribonucleotide monophosphatase NagD (HAD superfamily)
MDWFADRREAFDGLLIDIAQLEQRTGLPLAAQPERILTLGDSLKSDIRGANRLGLTSALVLTGITSEATLHGLPPDDEKVPDLVFAGLCGPTVLPP